MPVKVPLVYETSYRILTTVASYLDRERRVQVSCSGRHVQERCRHALFDPTQT
jgi:hypothetical protein